MADPTRPWTEPAVSSGQPDLTTWNPSLPAVARFAFFAALTAAAGAWLGYYFITPLPYLDLEAFRATVALHAVTGTVLVAYLATLLFGRRMPGGSALDLPLALLFAAYIGATAASLNWRVSLEVSLTALMAIGIFYVLSDGRLLRRQHVEAAFMLAMLAAAARALWEVGNDYGDWLRLSDAVRIDNPSFSELFPPTVPKVHDVGDHPNLLGGMLAMSLPFFAVALFRPLPASVRTLVALAVPVILMALFLTLARSAWLGAAAGTALALVLAAAVTPGGRALRRRYWPQSFTRRWLLVTLAPALLAGAGALAIFYAQSSGARPIWLYRESDVPRQDVLEAGAEMVRDHPWLGTGPGVYGLLYPEYSGRFPDHAFHSHNGFLQTAIDLGVPGVAAMLLLAGALAWLLWRGLRQAQGAGQLSLIACAGAFAAFGVFGLFDAPNGFKGPLAALAAVGAIAVLSAREGAPVPSAGAEPWWWRAGAGLQALARLAVPVALAGLLITWARLDVAHYYYSSSLAGANAERWPQAIDDGQHAVDLDPQLAIYRLQLGVAYGHAFQVTQDPALLGSAVTELEQGLELDPRSAIGHANLALLLAQTVERDRTREEALTAIRFANRDTAVVLAAATALEASGWAEEAVEAYSQVLFLDLGLADSPFWQDSAFRQERFADILGRSAIVLAPCTMLSLWDAGVPDVPVLRDDALARCRDHAAASPNDTGAVTALADALIADGAFDEAYAWLGRAVARQPDNPSARSGLGRWYAAWGDPLEAREQWLRAGQLGDVGALVSLGDSYPAGRVPPEVVDRLRAGLEPAAGQVQFHLTGILYYRFKFFRASPIAILLPGEWRDAVPGWYVRAQDALARWTAPAPVP